MGYAIYASALFPMPCGWCFKGDHKETSAIPVLGAHVLEGMFLLHENLERRDGRVFKVVGPLKVLFLFLFFSPLPCNLSPKLCSRVFFCMVCLMLGTDWGPLAASPWPPPPLGSDEQKSPSQWANFS